MFNFLSNNSQSSKRKLTELYNAKGYNRIPILPDEPECYRILKTYQAFPANLVSKEKMDIIDSKFSLLPGHVVILWWLENSRTNKNEVPSYFLYEYGLDFKKELLFLQNINLLDGTKITTLGKEILSLYSEVIRKHKARKNYNPDGSITYYYEDEESVLGTNGFETTGDFVQDQFVGKAFEQAQDLENAESAYLSAIKLSIEQGEIPPPNPFNRLAIIYRKQKRLDKEEEILNQALSYYDSPTDITFRDRLNKLKNKFNK